MSTELTADEVGRWAGRHGLSLAADRSAVVAATVDHVHDVVSVLRELDFGETPPLAAPDRRTEATDATV